LGDQFKIFHWVDVPPEIAIFELDKTSIFPLFYRHISTIKSLISSVPQDFAEVDTRGRDCTWYAQPGLCNTDGEFYTPSALTPAATVGWRFGGFFAGTMLIFMD
jgi:hypothetical protein